MKRSLTVQGVPAGLSPIPSGHPVERCSVLHIIYDTVLEKRAGKEGLCQVRCMPDRDRVLALHCSFAESEFGNEGLMQIYGAASESDRLSA